MSNIARITKELGDLVAAGAALLTDGQKDAVNMGEYAPRYESWYTKALAAVGQIIPNRIPEFKEAYRHEKRKEITYDTYAVSDFLLGLRVTRYNTPVFDAKQAFASKLLRQVGIVIAAFEIAPSVLRDIRATLRAELLDSDLDAATSLLKCGHLRSAGIVCGVILETHLRSISELHKINISKKNPGIGDFNEALKAASVYDTPTWRLIQRLADIRNLCGHRKERDPKPDEVEDLISGTGKITKEIS